MSPSIDTRENREFASEVKFLVDAHLANGIKEWARNFLAPDPHAGGVGGDGYQVTSIYFDTPAMDVFHRRNSYRKSKYRIRRYGSTGVAFLERKLKTRGLVSKRRTVVPLAHVAALQHDGTTSKDSTGYWFLRRLKLRHLKPVCQISYTRTARVAMTPYGPIRLTLDQDLCARPLHYIEFTAERGPVISASLVIVEMKFLVGLPTLFKHIIEEFRLETRPFSKYRFTAWKLRMAESDDFIDLPCQPQFQKPCLIS